MELSRKYTKWLIAIVTILIVLGTFNNFFSLAALFVCILNILIFDKESSMSMLMFLLPFSSIFKLSPSSQSFFTYIMLFYILYAIMIKQKIGVKFLMYLLALMTIVMLQAFASFDLLRFIKFFANIFLIYIAVNFDMEKWHSGIFLSFVFGVIISSLLSLPGVLPNLSSYVSVKDLGLSNDWLVRFSGMYGDPNYYSINVIISLCILVLLKHKREINLTLMICSTALLVYFAVITYSRSAFIMLLLPLLLFLYSNTKNKKYFLTAIFTVATLYIVALVFFNKIEVFNIVVSRFSAASGDVTSGRINSWKNYITFFTRAPFSFMFGHGLGAALVGGMAPHNTYIDFLYYFGLIGTLVFLCAIATIPNFKIKGNARNILNYGIFACVGIMYFFISEIFYIDFPFHIIIAWTAYSISFDKVKNDN